MSRVFGALVALSLACPASFFAQSAPPLSGDVYTVDNAHSLLDFTVRLVGFNRVRGNFADYNADIYYDPAHIEQSIVHFDATISSITTGVDERDRDLKAASFFDATRFPTMTFRSVSARPSPGGFDVTGDLTIRDSTRRITLPVQVSTPLSTDPFGNPRASFVSAATLNRRDYGVVGPSFWSNAISDSVGVEIELGARVWNWTTLGFNNGRGRHSVGEMLLGAADSNRLAAALVRARGLVAQHDSTWNVGAFEFEKAAMRLSQRQRYADALRILDLVRELTVSAAPDVRSEFAARHGEVNLRMGKRADAIADFREALSLQSTNTNAQVWLRVAGG